MKTGKCCHCILQKKHWSFHYHQFLLLYKNTKQCLMRSCIQCSCLWQQMNMKFQNGIQLHRFWIQYHFPHRLPFLFLCMTEQGYYWGGSWVNAISHQHGGTVLLRYLCVIKSLSSLMCSLSLFKINVLSFSASGAFSITQIARSLK